MDEKGAELLEKASELFMTLGIKSLTMSDISTKLGISKKTLYNYVTDKNDLVSKCIELHINANECEMSEVCQGSDNAIEELISFSKFAGAKMSGIHPSIFYDLQKYHPEAWNRLNAFEETTILNVTKANLQRGMKEGLFREDLIVEVIAQIYLSMVQNIFHNNVAILSGLPITQYYNTVFNYHIRGIASEEGITRINQLLK